MELMPSPCAVSASRSHARRVGAGLQLGRDAVGVEPELARVLDEVRVVEEAAGGVQRVVHLPEGALGGRGLGGLGRVAGVRVDGLEREVAEGEAQVVAQAVAHAREDRLRGRAVGALEVAVHDELVRAPTGRRGRGRPGRAAGRGRRPRSDRRLARDVGDLEFLFLLLLGAAALVRGAAWLHVPYPIVLVLVGLARRRRARAAGGARRPGGRLPRLPAAAAGLGGLLLLAARAARRAAAAGVPRRRARAGHDVRRRGRRPRADRRAGRGRPRSCSARSSRRPTRWRRRPRSAACTCPSGSGCWSRARRWSTTRPRSWPSASRSARRSRAPSASTDAAVGLRRLRRRGHRHRARRRLDPGPRAAQARRPPAVDPAHAAVPVRRLRGRGGAHVSGVLAAVVSGLYLGWFAHETFSADTRLSAIAFWEVLVFGLNALLFLLLGLQFPAIVDDARAGDSFGTLLLTALALAAVVVLIRLAGGASCRSRAPATAWRERLAIAWSGMRGAISLAAALSVPATVDRPARHPVRDGRRDRRHARRPGPHAARRCCGSCGCRASARGRPTRRSRGWRPRSPRSTGSTSSRTRARVSEEQLRRMRELYRARFRACQAVLGGGDQDGAADVARAAAALRATCAAS